MGLDDVIDIPPEGALLSLDAFGLRGRNGIVLTWKPSDEQIMVGDLVLDLGYIVVDIDGAGIAEMGIVAVECELVLLAGFPLVRPYCREPIRGRFKAESESAYAREKLHDLDLIRHRNPDSFSDY